MGRARRFSREFKLATLARREAGENVSALSRELGVRRKLLYQWRDAFRAGGPEALRGQGRPRKAAAAAGLPDAGGQSAVG
ncbi:MAG: transposase, partial [Kiloniellales bacterium]|nr:transposase [Kiloniellales bacterium]